MTYTHTRITTEHLAKLKAQAQRNKRSALKQLETLIDEEEARERRRIKRKTQ